MFALFSQACVDVLSGPSTPERQKEAVCAAGRAQFLSFPAFSRAWGHQKCSQIRVGLPQLHTCASHTLLNTQLFLDCLACAHGKLGVPSGLVSTSPETEMGMGGFESCVLLAHSNEDQVCLWQGCGRIVGDTKLLWGFGLCLPSFY